MKKESQTDEKASESEETEEGGGQWTTAKSWEGLILRVDTIERDPPTGKLWAFIVFQGEPPKRRKVTMETMKQKAPLKMLNFYEQHL